MFYLFSPKNSFFHFFCILRS